MAELSVVLPIYNVDLYLSDCLDSVVGQTFRDWEAILVDDGSTDFSGIICDSYSRKDDRFRVIHQENAGVSAARNSGIDAATAPLLAFIDPDDFISENYFSCLVGDLLAANAECAPNRRQDFEMLKLQYDFGCYNSFRRSGGRLNGRGLLFHLYELNQLPGRR